MRWYQKYDRLQFRLQRRLQLLCMFQLQDGEDGKIKGFQYYLPGGKLKERAVEIYRSQIKTVQYLEISYYTRSQSRIEYKHGK